MSPNRSTPYDEDPDADGSAPRAPAWAEEHLEVLRDLRDMGMTLARTLTRQVVAQAEADEARAAAGEVACEPPRRVAAVDPALSFSRISRAVRLTLALEARTHQAIEDAARRGAVANDHVAADGDLAGPIDYAGIARSIQEHVRVGRDFEIRRAVEETIEASRDDLDEVERLKDELKERLREDEVFDGRGIWPIGETISLICQDLGLTPDWDRWANQGWARREAEESPRGSPYATVERPPDPGRSNGTDLYRRARGLPPLEGPPPLRARTASRGPP
jgi:hypothetical protein